MDSSNKTGYNCQAISALGPVISRVTSEIASDIVTSFKNDIVTPMSSLWYGPDAQELFTQVATMVQKMAGPLTEIFNNFGSWVTSAGKAWANATGGEAPYLPVIPNVTMNLDVSAIKAKDAQGNVIIDETGAEALADTMGTIRQNLNTNIAKRKNELDAATSFIGHDQDQAIETAFGSVIALVDKLFKPLEEDTADGVCLKTAIKNASAKYAQQAEEVVSKATVDESGATY